MTIFIDSDFKCHAANDGAMRPVNTPFFDSKCHDFIEGYRYVPEGETWVREDGVEFPGEMVSPWKAYDELEKEQTQWEHEQLSIVTTDRDNLLSDIAALIEEVYTMDREIMA